MQSRIKQAMGACIIALSGNGLAGTMGNQAPSFSGLWLGVGGSYNSAILSGKTNINQISGTPTSAQYLLDDNLSTHFAPVANAGYFYAFQNDWYGGLKFQYKYIGQEQFDLTWSGTFSDGTYQTAGLRTRFIQDFFVLVDAAHQFDNWLVYAGAGPAWVGVRVDLNGDVLPPGSLVFSQVNQSKTHYTTGGAGQVGFQYMLPKRFAVDISYSFVASPSATIPSLRFSTTSSSNYSRFTQQVSVIEQGVNITVNKYWG